MAFPMPSSVFCLYMTLLLIIVHCSTYSPLDSGYSPGSDRIYNMSCSWTYEDPEDCYIYPATECSHQNDTAVLCVGMYVPSSSRHLK